MQMPNKLYTYKESVLSKFPIVLKKIEQGNCQVCELYKKVQKDVSGICEFMEVLDCLYALGKVEYDEKQEGLKIVSRNNE